MDIPIPAFIQHPERIHHKEILLKKESKKVWTEYYAVLCDHFLIFNMKNSQNGKVIPNNCTIVQLTPYSRVGYTRKKCYRFPFEIETDKLKYSFKCETNLQRYRWVFSIRRAIEGKPPKPAPKFIPTRKPSKKEDKRPLRSSRIEHRTKLHEFSQTPADKMRENGFYSNARINMVDIADESELNHSSTAVRLQKDDNGLLLTNKGAFAQDDDAALAEYKKAPRSLSFVDDDLEIVDFDSDSDIETGTEDKSSDSEGCASGIRADPGGSVGKSDIELSRYGTRNGGAISDNFSSGNKGRTSDLDRRREISDFHSSISKLRLPGDDRRNSKVLSCNDIDKDLVNTENYPSYRLYPDNMKSNSWTSFGILRKTTARRQSSAPSTSNRFQRRQSKVTFSPNTK